MRVLGKLHSIDPAAVGLAEFGRPDGYLLRQARHGSGHWEQSNTRVLPEMQELIG